MNLGPGDVATFGRGTPERPVDIPLSHEGVSRLAGEIRAEEDFWLISNLSRHATYAVDNPEGAGEYLKIPPRCLWAPVPFEFAQVVLPVSQGNAEFLVFAPQHSYADDETLGRPAGAVTAASLGERIAALAGFAVPPGRRWRRPARPRIVLAATLATVLVAAFTVEALTRRDGGARRGPPRCPTRRPATGRRRPGSGGRCSTAPSSVPTPRSSTTPTPATAPARSAHCGPGAPPTGSSARRRARPSGWGPRPCLGSVRKLLGALGLRGRSGTAAHLGAVYAVATGITYEFLDRRRSPAPGRR